MIAVLRSLIGRLKSMNTSLQSALTHARIRLKYPNVVLGKGVCFYGPIHLNIARTATVCIGDNVTFRSATEYNYVGISRAVSIKVGAGAALTIGDNCGFSGTAIVASQRIDIEAYCLFGGNSSVWDTDFHPLDYQRRRYTHEGTLSAPVLIRADAFIGANVLILKGATIGERAIVGAGAVVSKSIPADQIWGGNPARFIREQPRPEPLVCAHNEQLARLPQPA